MKIPQYDLDGLGGEFIITQGLEKEIAEFLGVKHCIFVSSGTAAIFLVLRAVGAKKVAIPNLTMIATATAAELAGCDITLVSNNELPEGVDAYVHVSLNGRDCGIEEVIKNNSNITVIEDACQSFGSKHNGQYLGTFGKAGCFSFSPHKILSAGNGGCVVTNDDAVARDVRRLKNFGRESGGADQHDFIGYNFKFTDIQAQFILPQFHDIVARLRKKKELYSRYYAVLSDIMLPHAGVPWFVDVYVNDRESLISYLNEKNIGIRKMYPLVSTQRPFANTPTHGNRSMDISHSNQGLWLPSSLNLTTEEVDFVIDMVRNWKKTNGGRLP